jgi:o-succinylbenzoate synthase
MIKAYYKNLQLEFKTPVLTSRGSMSYKNGYLLYITNGTKTGIGECSFIEGLSIDHLDSYAAKLDEVCKAIEEGNSELVALNNFPSIRFGLECAWLDYHQGGHKILYPSEFTLGKKNIAINGLVWMGNEAFMHKQIEEKLAQGFSCIKLKVGAIDFKEELKLLANIRASYDANTIELRLDANGAFAATNVHQKLEQLAAYNIHSIEQPIQPAQIELMQSICTNPIIPIALDEELIALSYQQKFDILSAIQPQYIILKPSLIGGFAVAEQWIQEAKKLNIGWWATSALESNIGLNAIAQWVFPLAGSTVQGLGTGSLYHHNIASPLYIANGQLGYNPNLSWDL